MRKLDLRDNVLTADRLTAQAASIGAFGLRIVQSPFIEPEQVITFDPQRKCTWAGDTYRAGVNAWLKERFGVQDVAYIFGKDIFVNPRAAVKLFGATG